MQIKRFGQLFESEYDEDGVLYAGTDVQVTKFMRATNEDTQGHVKRRGDERVYVNYNAITPSVRVELDDRLEFAGLTPEDVQDRELKETKAFGEELAKLFAMTPLGKKAIRETKQKYKGYRSDDEKAGQLAADLTDTMLQHLGVKDGKMGQGVLLGRVASRLRLLKGDVLKEVTSAAKAAFKSKYE